MRPPAPPTMIAKKQAATEDQWQAAFDRIGDLVSEDHVDQLVEWTVSEIAETVAGREVGYGWSGGKDSQALRYVAGLLGNPPAMLAVTDLEYPSFMKWVDLHAPDDLAIIENGWDLEWLADHDEMLFPTRSAVSARWFRGVQWKGQERWMGEAGIDMILLGRRHADGNYTGPRGATSYTTKGGRFTKYSPLADWTHEEVLALIHYKGLQLPPNYGWIRGWRTGTGPWAKRGVTTRRQGWDEIAAIDVSIIIDASPVILSAREYLG